jgi:hypothetical protein
MIVVWLLETPFSKKGRNKGTIDTVLGGDCKRLNVLNDAERTECVSRYLACYCGMPQALDLQLIFL